MNHRMYESINKKGNLREVSRYSYNYLVLIHDLIMRLGKNIVKIVTCLRNFIYKYLLNHVNLLLQFQPFSIKFISTYDISLNFSFLVWV